MVIKHRCTKRYYILPAVFLKLLSYRTSGVTTGRPAAKLTFCNGAGTLQQSFTVPDFNTISNASGEKGGHAEACVWLLVQILTHIV